MKENLVINATCLFGLESILRFEISKIGGENIMVTDGKVTFSGNESVLVNSNLWLRTAERVCLVLGTFTAQTFTELFDAIEKIPFEEYIGITDAFPVTGWSLDSTLHNVPSCQSIIKRAIVRRFEHVYGQEQFAETGPVHQIRFSIHKDKVTVMLDSTGISLHKRGYRAQATEAPIRESLAAGIVDLARVRGGDTVYDPMCGSGTLLIEAAMRARNIAPGLNRTFAAEKWGKTDTTVWKTQRKKAKESVEETVNFRGIGYDIDPVALKIGEQNAKLAGVADLLTFTQQDIKDFSPQVPSITLCNPPYGERLLEQQEALALFHEMGKVMPKSKENSYYIIGPQEKFEESFGRKASRRRKLYNGMLPTQLYMYFR